MLSYSRPCILLSCLSSRVNSTSGIDPYRENLTYLVDQSTSTTIVLSLSLHFVEPWLGVDTISLALLPNSGYILAVASAFKHSVSLNLPVMQCASSYRRQLQNEP